MHHTPPIPSSLPGRRSRKLLRAGVAVGAIVRCVGSGGAMIDDSRKQCFPNTAGKLLTVIVIACTRPNQAESNKIPAQRRTGEHQVLPLAEELLAYYSCWNRKSWFSLRTWSLVGWPQSRAGPTPQAPWAIETGLWGQRRKMLNVWWKRMERQRLWVVMKLYKNKNAV